MNDNMAIDLACIAYGSDDMKPEMYKTLFDAIAKEKGIDINKQAFEIGKRELDEWVANRTESHKNA